MFSSYTDAGFALFTGPGALAEALVAWCEENCFALPRESDERQIYDEVDRICNLIANPEPKT